MEMKFYNQSQVAKILGVSQPTVSVYCKPDKVTGKAKLGNYRLGTRTVISEADLKAFLESVHIEASFS